jgi:hypothetical protein
VISKAIANEEKKWLRIMKLCKASDMPGDSLSEIVDIKRLFQGFTGDFSIRLIIVWSLTK